MVDTCLLCNVVIFVYMWQLNAGVAEKVCLSSRDDDIILIVSYAELKRCLESSFAELTRPTQTANAFS